MKFFKNALQWIRLILSVAKMNKYLPHLAKIRESGDLEQERREIGRYANQWIDEVERIFSLTIDVSGRENLPAGPFVIIANHQGYADIFGLIRAAGDRQLGFIAKEELRKIPVLGPWIKAIHGIFIKRGDTRESLKSINEGVDLLKNGYSMAIFPEGTRSRGPAMNAFKAGAFKLATKAKVPVVPVTINGSFDMYEGPGVFTKGTTTSILIHPAIETAQMNRDELTALPDRVAEIIKSAIVTAE